MSDEIHETCFEITHTKRITVRVIHSPDSKIKYVNTISDLARDVKHDYDYDEDYYCFDESCPVTLDQVGIHDDEYMVLEEDGSLKVFNPYNEDKERFWWLTDDSVHEGYKIPEQEVMPFVDRETGGVKR